MDKSQFNKEQFREIINDMEDQIQLFEKYPLGAQSIGESWYKKNSVTREKLKDWRNLTEFRYNDLAVVDVPSGTNRAYKLLSPVPFLRKYTYVGKILEDAYAFIKKHKLERLLLDNPTGDVGAPVCHRKENLRYTNRWIRHIFLFSLLRKTIGSLIEKEIKVIMDIGSSYGALASIIKNNYPNTNIILVDIPEQLAIAKYYLKAKFPKAKFAKYNDLMHCEKINGDLISNYDFLLIPCFMYEKLEANSVDLVMNIVSFPEMSKEWLDHYTSAPVFCSIKYIFLVNRIIKEQNPGSKIDILDMHLEQYDRIHFDVCPFFERQYEQKLVFGLFPKLETITHPPLYEFIGKKPINKKYLGSLSLHTN
jgi:putative sugar O-methyltransferase